jgi:hypothetical protein
MEFLSDAWLTQFVSTHSMALKAAPFVVYGAFRLWATLNPDVPSNRVLDLLMGLWKGKGNVSSRTNHSSN